jgi:hypothetical protein
MNEELLMSHDERTASECLASALCAANMREFHRSIGLFLVTYELSGMSPEQLVDAVADLCSRTQEANRRLMESAFGN